MMGKRELFVNFPAKGLLKRINIVWNIKDIKKGIGLPRHCSTADVLPGQAAKSGGIFMYSECILILIS
jgi:hypothetical protein